MSKQTKTYITAGQLIMLTTVAVAGLRSLPASAEYGLGSITVYLIPAVVFLIPTALVAAELATGWKGGVFAWVGEALGARAGFVAGVGIVGCALAFVLGFIPPAQLPISGMPAWAYTAIMAAVVIVLGCPPLVFYALRKPNWRTEAEK